MSVKRFLLALTVVATSVAFAQVPIDPQAPAVDSPVVRALRTLHVGPMRRAQGVPATAGTDESYNWSGYAVTGTDFTEAKGSWTVPTITCTKSPNAWAVFWVGIDGYSNSTVEQTGTGVWCDRSTPVYFAWYEFYPAASITISTITITPGDKISASITYTGSKFTAKIEDVTTAKTFSISKAVSGAQRASAEWIAEAPETVTGIVNLADFTKANFGVAGPNSATDSTVTGVINDFGSNVEAITQVDDTNFKEANPSVLGTNGSSFSSIWIEYN
jgi:Peptidase A4 family